MLALVSILVISATLSYASENLLGYTSMPGIPLTRVSLPAAAQLPANQVSFHSTKTVTLPPNAKQLGQSDSTSQLGKFLRSSDMKQEGMETTAMKTETCSSSNLLVRGSGPVLSSPIIYPIFWGTAYWNSAAGITLKYNIMTMIKDMVGSSAFTSPINQYDTLNPGTIFSNYGYVLDESTTISQSLIEYDLNWWLSHYTFPGYQQSNYIYAFFFQPATTISAFGQTSCTNFCGFHGHGQTGSARYIVMPYLGPYVAGVGGGGCYAGCHYSNINYNYANVFSHELAETMTDPDLSNWRAPGAGGNEVGDICNAQWVFQTVPSPPGNCAGTTATYLFQKEWSNSACACV